MPQPALFVVHTPTAAKTTAPNGDVGRLIPVGISDAMCGVDVSFFFVFSVCKNPPPRARGLIYNQRPRGDCRVRVAAGGRSAVPSEAGVFLPHALPPAGFHEVGGAGGNAGMDGWMPVRRGRVEDAAVVVGGVVVVVSARWCDCPGFSEMIRAGPRPRAGTSRQAGARLARRAGSKA